MQVFIEKHMVVLEVGEHSTSYLTEYVFFV
jgi:hypothetical protein